MNGFRLAIHEWRAVLQSRKLVISLIAVLLVPLLYSYLYLWAFWDPYERLNELPVAVVNQDEGADLNGERINIGQELVYNLKEDPRLKWDFTTSQSALEGIESGKYYMIIQIPADFSKKAATFSEENPEQAEIFYFPNESRNLLASQLGERAMESLRTELQRKITQTYAQAMFDKFGETGKGLADAASGAKQLSEGLIVVKSGTSRLQAGVGELSSGALVLGNAAGQLKDGVLNLQAGLKQAGDGTTQVANGLGQLALKGNELNRSAKQLASGLQQVSQGLSGVVPKLEESGKGEGQLASTAKDSLSRWKTLLDNHPELANDVNAQQLGQELAVISEGLPKAAAGTESLSESLKNLVPSMEQMTRGSQAISGGLEKFTAGIREARDGALKVAEENKKLLDGTKTLAVGATKFAEGGKNLAAGGSALQSGLHELDNGVSRLTEGSEELSSRLESGAKVISDGLAGKDEKAKMIADPVELKQSKLHEVPNYGTGFSPYFISLALYVGALLLFIILDVHQVTVLPKRATAWIFGKLGVYAVLGALQAIIVAYLLQAGLGLQVVNRPMFYAMCILTSITFVVLIQGLISTLGEPGRFFAIVILMLQLTSSAGTFPLEMTPDFFRAVNPYLPMTYTVDGLKAVISNGEPQLIWSNMRMLAAFAVGCIVLTALLSIRRHPGAKLKRIGTAESATA